MMKARWLAPVLAFALAGCTSSATITTSSEPAPAPSKSCPPLDQDPYWNWSDEQIEEACGPLVIPSDQPGVTAEHYTDPDGDSMWPPAAYRLGEWSASSTILDPRDQDNWGIEWAGGSITIKMNAPSTDYRLVLADDNMDFIAGDDTKGTRERVITRSLAPGKYAVIVNAADGKPDPAQEYTVSVHRG